MIKAIGWNSYCNIITLAIGWNSYCNIITLVIGWNIYFNTMTIAIGWNNYCKIITLAIGWNIYFNTMTIAIGWNSYCNKITLSIGWQCYENSHYCYWLKVASIWMYIHYVNSIHLISNRTEILFLIICPLLWNAYLYCKTILNIYISILKPISIILHGICFVKPINSMLIFIYY